MALPDRIQAAQPSDLGGSFGCACDWPFLLNPTEPLGLGFHADQPKRGARTCAAIEFPKSEKPFPRSR